MKNVIPTQPDQPHAIIQENSSLEESGLIEDISHDLAAIIEEFGE